MRRLNEESTPVEKVRDVIICLAEHWARLRMFDLRPDVPWTNNPTEQGIGRIKMRARTVRRYKNWQGMASGLMGAGTGIK